VKKTVKASGGAPVLVVTMTKAAPVNVAEVSIVVIAMIVDQAVMVVPEYCVIST